MFVLWGNSSKGGKDHSLRTDLSLISGLTVMKYETWASQFPRGV